MLITVLASSKSRGRGPYRKRRMPRPNQFIREVHFLPPPLTLGRAPQRASGRDDIPKIAKRLPLNYMPVSGRLAALCYIHFYIFRSIHRHVVLMRAFT